MNDDTGPERPLTEVAEREGCLFRSARLRWLIDFDPA